MQRDDWVQPPVFIMVIQEKGKKTKSILRGYTESQIETGNRDYLVIHVICLIKSINTYVVTLIRTLSTSDLKLCRIRASQSIFSDTRR